MNVGIEIKKMRKKRSMSQVKLASACGITQTYLSQIENGKKEPNSSTLKSIANTLNFPLPVLYLRSLEESDIPESKRQAYQMLSPSINSLLDTLFSDESI